MLIPPTRSIFTSLSRRGDAKRSGARAAFGFTYGHRFAETHAFPDCKPDAKPHALAAAESRSPGADTGDAVARPRQRAEFLMDHHVNSGPPPD